MILGSEEKNILAGANFTDKKEGVLKSASQMRLFYPMEGETLWSVGKQFGVSRERIAEVNGLSGEEKLPSVIMIPVK